MNKLGKAGSILIIIASAIMAILSLIVLLIGGITFLGDGGIIIFLGIMIFALAITNIVLASLLLTGRQNLIIPTGIIAIITIFFAWVGWFFPSVLFLIGAIFLFCGKKVDSEENQNTETKITEPLEI